MAKKKSPLERMSEMEFEKWREEHLDRGVLSKRSLVEIILLLGLKDNFTVNCDEMHEHSYRCLDFKDRTSAIYLRLIREIQRYQKSLDRIRKEADYSPE
jgi:hypothetical protein